jgi:hypothetical protein
MNREDPPAPHEGLVLTHFLTVSDVARSRAFHAEVLGGQVVLEENPCIIKVANSWIIMNPGGGPTDDKPEVTLRPPSDSDHRLILPERPGGRHPGLPCRVEREGRGVPHPADRPARRASSADHMLPDARVTARHAARVARRARTHGRGRGPRAPGG